MQRRVVADRLLVLLLQLGVGELVRRRSPWRPPAARATAARARARRPRSRRWPRAAPCNMSAPTFFWKASNAFVTFASSTVMPWSRGVRVGQPEQDHRAEREPVAGGLLRVGGAVGLPAGCCCSAGDAVEHSRGARELVGRDRRSRRRSRRGGRRGRVGACGRARSRGATDRTMGSTATAGGMHRASLRGGRPMRVGHGRGPGRLGSPTACRSRASTHRTRSTPKTRSGFEVQRARRLDERRAGDHGGQAELHDLRQRDRPESAPGRGTWRSPARRGACAVSRSDPIANSTCTGSGSAPNRSSVSSRIIARPS